MFEKSDALLAEIKAFVECVEKDTAPLVTGEDGRNALDTAEKITALIHQHLRLTDVPH